MSQPDISPARSEAVVTEAESQGVSHAIRSFKHDTSGEVGVDTVRFLVSDFTVSAGIGPREDGHEWTFRSSTSGGETNAVPLFRPGGYGSAVSGDKAHRNSGLIRLTVKSVDCLLVECSLPRLIRESNIQEARQGDVARAIVAAERLLQRYGVTADLYEAKLSRLDLSRTVELENQVQRYEPVIRRLSFPRMRRERYEDTGARWRNNSREIVFYDKGLEQEGKYSQVARLEYRLRGAESIQNHVDVDTTADLMDNWQDATGAYKSAAERLLSADIEDESTVVGEGFRALLTSLEGEHGAYTKALLAYAVHQMDGDDMDAYLDAVRQTMDRSKLYRAREKLNEVQSLAGVLDRSATSEAALYRELSQKLAEK
jgi:hypothetical protein